MVTGKGACGGPCKSFAPCISPKYGHQSVGLVSHSPTNTYVPMPVHGHSYLILVARVLNKQQQLIGSRPTKYGHQSVGLVSQRRRG
jgi:hypothetical protein